MTGRLLLGQWHPLQHLLKSFCIWQQRLYVVLNSISTGYQHNKTFAGSLSTAQ